MRRGVGVQCLAVFMLIGFRESYMRCRTRRKEIVLVAILALAAMMGCKQTTAARMEKPIPMTTPTPAPQKGAEPPSAPLPAPTAAEVTTALHRIFGDDLIVEQDSKRPTFIAADLNGDDSQDLAVIVRPAPGKLADINSELANWIIQDANSFFIPPSEGHVVNVPIPAPPKVTEGEVILAIVHGHGHEGWRNPEAKQGYLVKHAAATFLGVAPSISEKSIRMMHLPVQTEILHELRDNKKGFLFWAGQAYAWHPNKG